MPPENSWLILIRGLFTKMMTIYPPNLCFSLHMDVRAKWLRSFISVLTCAQAVWGFSTVYHLGCTSSNPLSLFFSMNWSKGKPERNHGSYPQTWLVSVIFPILAHMNDSERTAGCTIIIPSHNFEIIVACHTHTVFFVIWYISHTHIHIHNYSCMWY